MLIGMRVSVSVTPPAVGETWALTCSTRALIPVKGAATRSANGPPAMSVLDAPAHDHAVKRRGHDSARKRRLNARAGRVAEDVFARHLGEIAAKRRRCSGRGCGSGQRRDREPRQMKVESGVHAVSSGRIDPA